MKRLGRLLIAVCAGALDGCGHLLQHDVNPLCLLDVASELWTIVGLNEPPSIAWPRSQWVGRGRAERTAHAFDCRQASGTSACRLSLRVRRPTLAACTRTTQRTSSPLPDRQPRPCSVLQHRATNPEIKDGPWDFDRGTVSKDGRSSA